MVNKADQSKTDQGAGTDATALTAFCRRMPKVELHCHLLGTVRKVTFIDLASKARAPISEQEIDLFYARGEKPVGAIRVLRALDQYLLKSADDFYRITAEYLEDAWAHGVRYSEFSWNPTGTLRDSGLTYAEALSGIRRAIWDAQSSFGMVGRVIAAVDREAGVQAAQAMLDEVIAHRCDEVIGLGMDYREENFPPEMYAPVYRRAGEAGLRLTAHAGEFGMPWGNVAKAIDVLGVDRVDHGYTVLESPELIQRCSEKGLVFTVVPTNSYYLRTLSPERWALDHPIRHMPAAGLRIHPNTDDPTLHHVNPSGAWQMMVEEFGFSITDLKGFMINGIDASWMDEARKHDLRGAWSAEFEGLKAELRLLDRPSACGRSIYIVEG
jgi:adenine deaminase